MNNIRYKTTGQIVGTIKCDPSTIALHLLNSSDAVIEGDTDPLNTYIADVNNPIVTLKPSSTVALDKPTVTANGVDAVTLTNIPPNSILLVKGNGVDIREAVALSTKSITFDLPGTYFLTVKGFPYLNFEAIVNAT